MNRTAAVVLAALAIAACGPTSNSPPLTNVTIWWEFDRNTLIDGVIGIQPYDTRVNWPPGTGSGACPQSGVDFVIVFDNAGNQLSPPTPCINQDVQGAVITGFMVPSVYWVEGWRNGIPCTGGRSRSTGWLHSHSPGRGPPSPPASRASSPST
jgi:hypothetical protein